MSADTVLRKVAEEHIGALVDITPIHDMPHRELMEIIHLAGNYSPESELITDTLYTVRHVLNRRLQRSVCAPHYPQGMKVTVNEDITWADVASQPKVPVKLSGRVHDSYVDSVDGLTYVVVAFRGSKLGLAPLDGEPDIVHVRIVNYALKEYLTGQEEVLRELVDDQPPGTKDFRELRDFKKHLQLLGRNYTTGEINEYSKRVLARIDLEIDARHERAQSGPTFSRHDIVEVTEPIFWWPKATSAEPKVGLRGRVKRVKIPNDEFYRIEDPKDVFGLVKVRFLATDLGYLWEEGDDADRKYCTYFMPNYVLKKVD